FVRPVATWEDFHQRDSARELFRRFRTPGVGEQMILEGNAFIEQVLPAAVKRKLGDEEMAVYRAPFPTPESRRPLLALPRDLPIEGVPADVDAALAWACHGLAASTCPKLLFAGDPGALISPAAAEAFAARLRNCAMVRL